MSYDPQIMKLENNGDEFYAALMQAHEGLNEDQSNRLNARLVLLMANQIGDTNTLKAIIADAKAAGE